MMDWIKILSAYPRAAVEEACDKWLANESRRPAPGDLRKLCGAWMRRKMPERMVLPKPREPERGPRVTAEAAQRIMREVGVDPSRVVRRMPAPGTQPGEQGPDVAPEPYRFHRPSEDDIRKARDGNRLITEAREWARRGVK